MSSAIEQVTDFGNLIDNWKAEHQNEGYDPLPFLTRCAEILELALVEFQTADPDACGKRHPTHVLSASKFGTLLTLLEDCREFNDAMTSMYLKTNASPNNVGRVVITSARLAVLIDKGYRITGLDTEECVKVLISWIIYASEPLRTYATGLIDGCCVIKQSTYDRSITLITTLLKRLWNYLEPETYKEPKSIVYNEERNESNPRKRKHSTDFISEKNSEYVVRDSDITGPTCVNDSNNSNCLEQMPAMLGVNYRLEKPLIAKLCHCYTFDLLKCFGELQEFQSTFYECNVLPLISRYLKMKSEDRVVEKALEFLSTLFCHDKVATDFFALNGVVKLIDIPRPSRSSARVALCLHNLACRKDAMEKICDSPAHILRELIKYAKWLLECSHDFGKSHIVLFFSLAFSYQNVLSLFDDMGGLRCMVNMISTTKYFVHAADDEYDPREDPDLPYSASQIIKPACAALKKYFEAHVVFKVGQLVKSCPVQKLKYSSFQLVTKYETATHAREQHFEYLHALRELAEECDDFNLDSWAPIALFQILDGVPLLTKIVCHMHEFEVAMPAQGIEVSQVALDVLCAVTLSQSGQMMITNSYPNLGLVTIGLHDILAVIEIFLCINDASYRYGVTLNSAVAVIANCTEGTRAESGDDTESVTSRYDFKKRMVKEKSRKLIRQVGGVNKLLSLLDVTKPAQTADETRYLACKALLGLAEHQPVREILPKLHILTSKLLPAVQKPVFEEKKELYIKFRNNLELLLKRIVTRKAITLDVNWKTVLTDDVVSKNRARYDNEDLLLMIYIHLVLSGLSNNDASLMREAGIFPEADDNFLATSKSVRKLDTSHGSVTADPKVSESNRNANPVTYDVITDHNLKHQHSKRQNPLFTVPQLSIFPTHRCSKPRNKFKVLMNVHKRHYHRQRDCAKRHGLDGIKHDLRMIYSRFRPARVIRSNRDQTSPVTAVAFNPADDCGLILGDGAGNFHFLKAPKFENRVKTGVFDSAITQIEPSYSGDMMLALSSMCWSRNCALLAVNDTLDVKLTFDGIAFVEFSKTVQDKIVATSAAQQATIYDANTGTTINTYGKDDAYLEDRLMCLYDMNRATFSYDDRLLLSNGSLWDLRRLHLFPIHRFDKFNYAISGVFHPNGFEVIINTEIWDVRNFKLIQTVPDLDQCRLLFNRSGSVMYAVKIDTDVRPDLMSAFRTFDSSNYNQLGYISLKQQVYAIALDDWERNIAVIERNAEDLSVSVCRMYEVGMMSEYDDEEE